MDQYRALGVMSGSSLDGLDLCYCTFGHDHGHWTYQITAAETIPISDELTHQLRNSAHLSGMELHKLDIHYGEWVGSRLHHWLKKHSSKPSLIGFHGHTVFHEPDKKISIQLGNGQAIALQTNVPVVDQFRSLDVMKGGQGAPLVPVGEHHLFPAYQGFLNLGGIANLSIHKDQILAWDVAPCNQVLNHFASLLGQEYDQDGKLAVRGHMDERWYRQVGQLKYFGAHPPKSLSNQWTKKILDIKGPNPADALATYSHLLAELILRDFLLHLEPHDQVLITGGGAFNHHLISLLRSQAGEKIDFTVPERELVSCKEALVFAFLGLLRLQNEPNIFRSVTGASSDSCAGLVHLPDGAFSGDEFD